MKNLEFVCRFVGEGICGYACLSCNFLERFSVTIEISEIKVLSDFPLGINGFVCEIGIFSRENCVKAATQMAIARECECAVNMSTECMPFGIVVCERCLICFSFRFLAAN